MRSAGVWLATVLVGLAAVPACAVEGCWVSANRDSVLAVRAGDGTLHGVIVAVRDRHFTAQDKIGTPGELRVDLLNPDPALRGREILGIDIFAGFAEADGLWQGSIYDPQSGKVYSANARVDDGELLLRGYVGVPMFGRTAVFTPLAAERPAWLGAGEPAGCGSD